MSLNEEGLSVAVRGLVGEKLCSRDLACKGHYIPHWNGGNSREEGEDEGEGNRYLYRIAQNGCEETE